MSSVAQAKHGALDAPARAAAIWPNFRGEWIVREDRDLVFVNKPCGVPTQSAEPDEPDDLVTRLGRHLRERDGGDGYVGVHQRLDKDTSGVIVFAKSKDVNAHLAKVFEGRRAKKVYVACVSGFRGKAGVWEDVIDGQKARSHVKVLATKAARFLLEVAIETGRTHQIRIQMEKRGSPVAGDPLYGGARAPRLMLHSRTLAFELPNGRAVETTVKPPVELET